MEVPSFYVLLCISLPDILCSSLPGSDHPQLNSRRDSERYRQSTKVLKDNAAPQRYTISWFTICVEGEYLCIRSRYYYTAYIWGSGDHSPTTLQSPNVHGTRTETSSGDRHFSNRTPRPGTVTWGSGVVAVGATHVSTSLSEGLTGCAPCPAPAL